MKSYTSSYLLSRVFRRNKAIFNDPKRIIPEYTVKSHTSSYLSSLFWFWLLICIALIWLLIRILLLVTRHVIVAASLFIFMWLLYRYIGFKQPTICTLVEIDEVGG